MDDEVEGLSVALTPVQMAAVLGDQEVPESASLSNRLWGTVGLVGGVVELLGAGVLCVAPEPTMMTKAGCVVLGVHGYDTLTTSSRQVWTGTPQRTVTAVTASSAAEALGASRETADGIGLAVDIAVPLAVASGLVVARVIAVRAGRFRLEPVDLLRHEGPLNTKIGGHTIREHVGKTEVELFERLVKKPSLPKVSSFHNLDIAERAISATVRANARAIKAWSRSAATGSKPMVFEHNVGSVVGIGVQRGSSTVSQLSSVRVILNMKSYNGMPYYILTAHPF
ncbi:hypothetical protein QFZ42_003677 [Variovorax paradoxus]|uniref:RNase A-like domain-containing protein n=1 Tax=Variovorax paradoxus TaxID=34073 RepID=UPI0027910CB4|nr:RNase A-like domain-containing protein [Variovorax paradoxus]MDQ0571843.1 hypothetical protein [Variovorax paradoxus]